MLTRLHHIKAREGFTKWADELLGLIPYAVSVPMKGFELVQVLLLSHFLMWSTEWDTPESNFIEEGEKGTQDCANHTVGWFQREKFKFLYIPHSLERGSER